MIRYMPDKIASAVSYCVSGSLICGGGILQWLHDLDWNKVAVIGGFLIGIATYLTNLYFKTPGQGIREGPKEGLHNRTTTG